MSEFETYGILKVKKICRENSGLITLNGCDYKLMVKLGCQNTSKGRYINIDTSNLIYKIKNNYEK